MSEEDPFLWLEEIEGERALEWVAAQNARTLAAWGGPAFEADRDAVKAGLDRPPPQFARNSVPAALCRVGPARQGPWVSRPMRS